jgi:hypothetical protein
MRAVVVSVDYFAELQRCVIERRAGGAGLRTPFAARRRVGASAAVIARLGR